MYHVIFDMDGVLSDSWDRVIEVLIPIGLHGKTRDEVLKSHMEYCTKKPHHAVGGSMTKEHKERVDIAMKQLADGLNSGNIPLFQKFVNEIKQLNGVFAVVSSNGADYVYKKAKEAGLPFTHVLAWEDSPHKEEKIKRVCSDWNILPQETYYVTDTLADVYELETILPRDRIIGCAWGYCGYVILREELPKNQILREPEDIHTIFP